MADDPDEIQNEFTVFVLSAARLNEGIKLGPIDRCVKTVTRHGKPTIVDIIIPEVVNWAMENRPFITIIETEEIYFYIKGRYYPHGDKLIRLMLQMAFGSLTNEKDKPVLTESQRCVGGPRCKQRGMFPPTHKNALRNLKHP